MKIEMILSKYCRLIVLIHIAEGIPVKFYLESTAETIGMKGFIMINVEPGTEKAVHDCLQGIKGIREVVPVYGERDFIAILDVESIADLNRAVLNVREISWSHLYSDHTRHGTDVLEKMHSFKNFGSLAPLYLAVFVAVLGFSLVAPFFPDYAMDLGANYTMLGLIVSIYGAVQLVTQIPVGRLSDRMGRRKILLLGLVTFTFLPPLYIYAGDAYSLLLIRALGGLGAALVWPTAMALIIDQARPQSRGAAMGCYNAAFFSALALGPLIGGMLYDLMGLEAPFYFWALLGMVSSSFVIVSISQSVKEPEEDGRVQMRTSCERREGKTGKEPLIAPGIPQHVSCLLLCCSLVWCCGRLQLHHADRLMLPVLASPSRTWD